MPSVKKIHSSPNKHSNHYDFSQKRVFEERSVEQSNVQTPVKINSAFIEKESPTKTNGDGQWYKESPNVAQNIL